MDSVRVASDLVRASLGLYDRLSAFYNKHVQLPQDVTSVRRDLWYIEEAIIRRSHTPDPNGIRSSWLHDLRTIKRMMEDAVQYYDSEFISGNTATSSNWSGIGAWAVDNCLMWFGPEKKLLGYLDEVKRRITDARKGVDNYQLISPQLQDVERISGNDEDYHHPKEADPVGLETATRDLVLMLIDATLLRVVAISGPDHSVLAEAAYNQEKEKFQCKAWVTVSHGPQKLLLAILDELGAAHQNPQNLVEITQILRNFLMKKRYIIGICGLETTDYWNDVRCAFPDDNTSSRIIVITIKEEIAQACRKNCTAYSLEATEENILKMLSRNEYGERRRVVAIHGRHGSGKTISVEAAFNKVKLEEEFEYKAWIRATQDGKKFLRDILDQLGAPQPDSKIALELVERLNDLLKNKRYIIVIDGLETTTYWKDVLYACPDDNTSSRIIVTTTREQIALKCCDNDICSVFMMPVLDKASVQDLLVRNVFGKDGCPNNLREDLNIILETCEYLPLAVSNIGDYMRGLKQDWDYANCEELCIRLSSLLVDKRIESFRGMRHVLNRSYTSLDTNAKAVLLSLSSYPSDLDINNHVIKKNRAIKVNPLIRRLLVEKSLSPAESSASVMEPLDDLIMECLTPLIEHNFIIPTEYNIRGVVKSFRVNYMLPQFIKEKGDQENYVTKIDIQEGLEAKSQSDITRLYLHNTSSSEHHGIREKIISTHVRLLTFHGEASKALMCFNDYTFLQVLILENCEGMKDANLDSVCRPRFLRYLSIRGNKKLTKLPDDIRKMLLLETLDTRGTMVHMLPMKVILLPKLAHLFGEFKIVFKEREFHSLKASVQSCQLQTLAGFFVDESPLFIKLLPFMTKLRKVKMLHWQAAHGGDGSQMNIALNDSVRKDLVKSLSRCFNWHPLQSKLRSLSFDFGGGDLDFLNDLEVPSYLVSLKLRGKLTILPKWITSQCNLEELCLSGSYIGHLSELQCLEKLVYLKLTGDSTEDSFNFEEEYIWHGGWFKALKRLHLNFPMLPKIVIQKGAMPVLKFLQLSSTDLGGFDGIENLRHLEELNIPSAATSAKASNLLNKVKTLPTRPRISRSGSGKRKLGLCKQYQRFQLTD